MASDSPRTDAHELKNGGAYAYDLARTLERELADAKDEAETANEIISEYVDLTRWYAVADACPDPDLDVLCYWGDHTSMAIGSCFGDPEIWHPSTDQAEQYDVPPTHWMPLPKTPARGVIMTPAQWPEDPVDRALMESDQRRAFASGQVPLDEPDREMPRDVLADEVRRLQSALATRTASLDKAEDELAVAQARSRRGEEGCGAVSVAA